MYIADNGRVETICKPAFEVLDMGVKTGMGRETEIRWGDVVCVCMCIVCPPRFMAAMWFLKLLCVMKRVVGTCIIVHLLGDSSCSYLMGE